jgi:hypothetical protein
MGWSDQEAAGGAVSLRSLALLGLTTAQLACAARPNPYVTLIREIRGDAVLLRLVPAPGARINAHLKPALERPDGTVLRFDSPSVTPDSSYFTAPPELIVKETGDGRQKTGSTGGVIRASVCPEGENVCRMVEVKSEE